MSKDAPATVETLSDSTVAGASSIIALSAAHFGLVSAGG